MWEESLKWDFNSLAEIPAFYKSLSKPGQKGWEEFDPKSSCRNVPTTTSDSFKLKFGKREGLSENDQYWAPALQRGPIGKEVTSDFELADQMLLFWEECQGFPSKYFWQPQFPALAFLWGYSSSHSWDTTKCSFICEWLSGWNLTRRPICALAWLHLEGNCLR